MLSDSVIAQNLTGAVGDFKTAGANTAQMTQTAKNIVEELHAGRGIAYRIFADTSLSNKLDHSLRQIQQASLETSAMMTNLQQIAGGIKQGDGTAGLVLTDTLACLSLLHSLQSIEQGTGRFNENMEALKSNFLFRGYFRRQQKKRRDTKDTSGVMQRNP